ncbi:MAG: hypothetical protein WAM14_09395 [Candidatus Nitrosopolaris sp.]
MASTGLTSIATAACFVLDEGSYNKNTPGILVALLSQSPAPLRKPASRSSIARIRYYIQAIDTLRYFIIAPFSHRLYLCMCGSRFGG